MPSIEESKRQVKAGLKSAQQEIDHDAILASLQDEIDRHNEQDDGNGERRRRRKHRSRSGDREERERPLKFRFKSGTSDPRDRKRRKHHRRKHTEASVREEDAAHPFPREPTNPDQNGQYDANAAFRDSLFDALADDEGAAYWESVYSQPIHVYPRPAKESAKGELEQMGDDEYAAYVQSKMWEKKNPEIVREREQKQKQRKEEEEERTRRREDFVRSKQRAAWERAERDGARKFAGVDGDAEYEYEFDFEGRTKTASKRSSSFSGSSQKEYLQAWQEYMAAWDQLKQELLARSDAADGTEPSKRIPWPVLAGQAVTRPNLEAFMQNVPQSEKSRLQVLKAERVKWHPDKIQQRFGGTVDEGTMKVVTGVFHVVDAALEEERKRA